MGAWSVNRATPARCFQIHPSGDEFQVLPVCVPCVMCVCHAYVTKTLSLGVESRGSRLSFSAYFTGKQNTFLAEEGRKGVRLPSC